MPSTIPVADPISIGRSSGCSLCGGRVGNFMASCEKTDTLRGFMIEDSKKLPATATTSDMSQCSPSQPA